LVVRHWDGPFVKEGVGTFSPGLNGDCHEKTSSGESPLGRRGIT
jgi:hypothetical protein